MGSSGRIAPPEDRGNGAAAAGGIETASHWNLSAVGSASGRLHLGAVTASVGGTITRLMVGSSDGMAMAATLSKLALFTLNADGSLTRVAITANIPNAGDATFTAYEAPTLASYVTYPGARYVLGFLQVATVAMKLQCVYPLDVSVQPAGWYIDGQADIAATYSAAALNGGLTYYIPYLRARP